MERLGRPEQREDHEKMQRRIEKALNSPYVQQKVYADFKVTLLGLGLKEEIAESLAKFIMSFLVMKDYSLEELEKIIFRMLEEAKIGRKYFFDVLADKLAGRADKIFDQIREEFDGVETVMDFGCGDGLVSVQLRDNLGLNVKGCDVRNYLDPTAADLDFVTVADNRVAVPSQSVDATVLTNVLHHEANNERLLAEVNRITKKRLIVIETVPNKDDPNPREAMERTFMNDYLYNRIFHQSDVPVPGTFERYEDWPNRFAKYGWKVVRQEYLGVDQPIIQDHHVIYILERDESISSVQAETRGQLSLDFE